jgi:hypothetical protein
MGCSPHKIQKQRRIVLVLVLVLETGPEKSDYENEDDDEDEINRQIKLMELNHCGKCAPREQQSRPDDVRRGRNL